MLTLNKSGPWTELIFHNTFRCISYQIAFTYTGKAVFSLKFPLLLLPRFCPERDLYCLRIEREKKTFYSTMYLSSDEADFSQNTLMLKSYLGLNGNICSEADLQRIGFSLNGFLSTHHFHRDFWYLEQCTGVEARLLCRLKRACSRGRERGKRVGTGGAVLRQTFEERMLIPHSCSAHGSLQLL